MKIAIISGSVRENRQTIRVSLHLTDRLKSESEHQVEHIDLAETDLPVMHERLRMLQKPDPAWLSFGQKVNEADAIIIVSPEYNGSYSGALKNALDYLKSEYTKKPFGIVTVSSGQYGGINASHHLESWVLHVKGYPSPFKLLVPHVEELFNADGEVQQAGFEKQVSVFIQEFLWLARAIVNEKQRGQL